MRRTAVLLALTASLTLLSCEGGDGEGASNACGGKDAEHANSGAKALPRGADPLRPGRYLTRDFEPPLSFEVGEGWEIWGSDEPTQFGIARADSLYTAYPRGFGFSNPPEEASDPEHPEELVPAPETPDDWVAWFQEHRYLEADEPEPACFGGAPGEQFGLSVSPLADDYYSIKCQGRYAPLWPLPAGHYWCADPRTESRVIVLEVEGETVIIDITAPPGRFDEFVSEVQKVIDTVEWKGT